MTVITLLTDFGTQDPYVGVMKGVILTINPSATIVDISHHINPQDIRQAAYMIHSAYQYFPDGTIHVIVVDPGVGTDRTIIAAKSGAHTFLAPDNGLLTLVYADPGFEYAVKVDSSRYFLNSVSSTFHGRDILAPVSAHLSLGVNAKVLGPLLNANEWVTIALDQPDVSRPFKVSGRIVSIDHFGNLITNIDEDCIRGHFSENALNRLIVQVNQQVVKGLAQTYSNAEIRQPAVFIGSHGYVEIAVNRANAQQFFNAQIGDAVLLWQDDD